MRLFNLHSLSAAAAAVLFSALCAGAPAAAETSVAAPCALPPTAADWHARLAAQPAAARAGQTIAVAVDLAASADVALDADGGLRYGMAFNDVAEGWSWQPQTRPEDEDYYRWKFLPLQTVTEHGASYVQEEKVGVPQQTRVERRHDYFLAFDNPYRFYARGDAGFVLPLPAGAAAVPSLRLVAIARLGEPATGESTTFWKAVHARPVDFTLKKHYLIGALSALVACDARDGRELARIVADGQR
ncbi:hypothetical protein [Azospira restricta]|uniref:Lipoprotein n=1 Tax=Azospira restricta TaxID=404405 RepID=A0A974PXM5_9RHOO|nr:hypothetical protein [Azospira restricta]QRJ63211.1 hypothetical protein IWH25_15890 [Azospira restricta]